MTFCFWAGVAKITLVLTFMKSNKFYHVQPAKVVNSKKMLAVKRQILSMVRIFTHFSNSNFLLIDEIRRPTDNVFNSFGFIGKQLVNNFPEKICCNLSYKHLF